MPSWENDGASCVRSWLYVEMTQQWLVTTVDSWALRQCLLVKYYALEGMGKLNGSQD